METNKLKEKYSIAKDMKYEALYWALGYEEIKKGIFEKYYDNYKVVIDSNNQYVDFGEKISIVNGTSFLLTSHKSFVVLECIDKLLSMGYSPYNIIIDLDNEYDIFCKNLYIKCFEWGKEKVDNINFYKDVFLSITYSSKLVSGLIQRKYSVKNNLGNIYKYGIFEHDQKLDKYNLYNSASFNEKDFLIDGYVVKKYLGKEKVVTIPEGIKELDSCLFWDNHNIEEIVLPDSLISMGGDTFYNCINLRKVNIPKNVKHMGNNPFAGCPYINIINESKHFHFENGVLYNNDYTRLIYCSISKKEKDYKVNEHTRIIGKHAFYLCNNLEKIILPSSLVKLENNPFSGCEKLDIINNSLNYHIIDKVIYDKEKDSVIGCLNSIDCDELILLNVKRICRNSFWNCKGIRKIIFPKTLEDIGYNPFVGCKNIEFVSHSPNYIVENNILFTKNKSKIVCYPSKFAIGEIFIPDSVTELERGAFSGCEKMTSINLHNVSIISKSCFTNCNSLTKVYCSDLVSYIGEWAFAHCKNLKNISIYKDCFVDRNVISNTDANIIYREERSNYIFESDNIFTLKSMNNSLTNKIKTIIIDPPYNSCIDGIGYKDQNFQDGYNKFIEDRIKLSEPLLTKDGFMITFIDKGEYKTIYEICKKYFAKVKIYKWEKLHSFFDKNRNVNPNKKKVKYEYIIIAFKDKKNVFNSIMSPYIKDNQLLERKTKVPNVFRCFGTNSSAKDEIKELFGDRTYFSTPKPVKLVKELVRATTDKNSIVLDYFAGSGTTGHAVFDLNKEDGGNRKFILITNDESNICRNITIKRMEKINCHTVNML